MLIPWRNLEATAKFLYIGSDIEASAAHFGITPLHCWRFHDPVTYASLGGARDALLVSVLVRCPADLNRGDSRDAGCTDPAAFLSVPVGAVPAGLVTTWSCLVPMNNQVP